LAGLEIDEKGTENGDPGYGNKADDSASHDQDQSPRPSPLDADHSRLSHRLEQP
jgi:hypothetical protein